MPINVRCKCGKTLKAPDSAAGKAVKCPGCGTAVRVAPPKPKTKSAPATAPTGGGDDLEGLFEEEGLTAQASTLCPSCRTELPVGTVLCIKCGFNLETGEQIERHLTEGLDIDAGTVALQRAEHDMGRDKDMQKTLLKGGGLPWWGLLLVLFIIGSGATIAVLSVNASKLKEGPGNINEMGLFLTLAGSGCAGVALGAFLMIARHAFSQNKLKGVFTVLFPPLALYQVFTNFRETWRFLGVLLLLGGAAAGCFVGASRYGMF